MLLVWFRFANEEWLEEKEQKLLCSTTWFAYRGIVVKKMDGSRSQASINLWSWALCSELTCKHRSHDGIGVTLNDID